MFLDQYKDFFSLLGISFSGYYSFIKCEKFQLPIRRRILKNKESFGLSLVEL